MTCRSTCLSIASFFFLSVGALGAEYPAFTFPQLASGQGLSCEIVLTNPGSEVIHGTVYFLDSSGDPLEIQLGSTPVSQWEFTLPAGGSVRAMSGSTGSLAVGYAEVKLDRLGSHVSGMVVYRLGEHEISVPAASLVTEGHIFVDQGAGLDSGLAVANSSSETLHLRLLLLDSAGHQLASDDLEVGPLGKFANLVPELLDGLPSQFTGTLHLVGDRGFTMIGLRQRQSGALSTLSCSDRALEGSVPVRVIVSSSDGLMNINGDGQVTKATQQSSRALDVYDSRVFIGSGPAVTVYDSAYRPIRQIELEESFGYLTLKVLPGDRIALVNNNTDEIRIIDFEGRSLATIPMPAEPDLQSCYQVVIGGDLFISETGSLQLFFVDLRTYEGRIFRDLSSELSGNLGPLSYADGFYYLVDGGERIYRFTETGPPALVATVSGNISGMQVVNGIAYVSTLQGGSVLAIDLESGTSQVVAAGLDRPRSLVLAPGNELEK